MILVQVILATIVDVVVIGMGIIIAIGVDAAYRAVRERRLP